MQKNTLYIIASIVLLGGALYIINSKQDNHEVKQPEQIVLQSDYKDAEYVIDGTRIKLENGVSEIEEVSESKSKIITQYFGNEVKKDLNDDDREDVVFLLTQNSGGSGTFFYVVAALNTENGYVGSNAILLGDRIAPQATESGEGKTVIVNYMDRAPEEPFTIQPSVGKSVWLLLDPETIKLSEVSPDFEIIEILQESCSNDTNCETPMHYLIQSHCPYGSKCINEQCAVVCSYPFKGKIIPKK